MTLNKTAVAAIISLAALTGFSGMAVAQNGNGMGPQNTGFNGAPCMYNNGPGMNKGANFHRGYMANLTAEQQAAAQKAFTDFRTKTADLHQQLMSKNYEYKALLTSKTVDEQKIQAVSKEISALRDNLYQQRVALDVQLAKDGIPAMGNRMGMGGHGKGMHMHGGRGFR